MSAAPVPAWLIQAIAHLERGEPCALVTIAAAEGSAPREAGSKMLVHRTGAVGSIGGGHLELKAIERARETLGATDGEAPMVLKFALGPSLGQCCGGKVTLVLERLTPAALPWLRPWQAAEAGKILATRLVDGHKSVLSLSDPDPSPLAAWATRLQQHGEIACLADIESGYLLERMESWVETIYLFGAGHVGWALVHVLAPLPYDIHWIDERTEMFPADPPANVAVEISAAPRHDVARAPAGAIFLVMTHSHALDLEICDRVLKRGDFSFLGLIGSTTKRATFLRRLGQRGHSDAAIARLTCPIGLPQVPGKQPGAIAIAVAAQLLVHSAVWAAARAEARRSAPRRAVNARSIGGI